MNEAWGIMGMKRICIKIIGRDKGEPQVNGIDHIFNKMVEEIHPN